jgi:divalent metal cation (Fe/Co/Zn/Cd) transporter
MPDFGDLPALDVAIGLAFLFFLLSTVCSAIKEAIANLLGWRAKTLEDAIRKLLG